MKPDFTLVEPHISISKFASFLRQRYPSIPRGHTFLSGIMKTLEVGKAQGKGKPTLLSPEEQQILLNRLLALYPQPKDSRYVKCRHRGSPAQEAIGIKLKELRESGGWSRQKFIEFIRPYLEGLGQNHVFDQSALYRIEVGKQTLTFIEALGTCKALNISLDRLAEDLFTEEERGNGSE